MPLPRDGVAGVRNADVPASLRFHGIRSMALPPVGEDDPCVWTIDLDVGDHQLVALHDLLSSDERSRASRFAFPHLRRRFICCRGALRVVLSSMLELDPSEIRFTYGPYGKPALAAVDCGTTFNVSHAGDRALIVTACDRRVGVDIERIEPLRDGSALAVTVFTESERRALDALRPEDRLAGFYAGWTRKEAFVKALGLGLAQPLTGCDVSMAPTAAAQLLRHEGDAAAPDRWTMRSLAAGEGYAAAMCYERVPPATHRVD